MLPIYQIDLKYFLLFSRNISSIIIQFVIASILSKQIILHTYKVLFNV